MQTHDLTAPSVTEVSRILAASPANDAQALPVRALATYVGTVATCVAARDARPKSASARLAFAAVIPTSALGGLCALFLAAKVESLARALG